MSRWTVVALLGVTVAIVAVSVLMAQGGPAPNPPGPRGENVAPKGGGEDQPPPPPPGDRGPRRPPGGLMMEALDSDKNGELSAEEIANASKSLLTLDKNGDGKLTRDELFPPPPDGKGRPDGGGPKGGEKGDRPPRPPQE